MEEKDLNNLFLGQGWSFPPTFLKSDRGVTMVSAIKDIEQSLEILLGTTMGERLMHPDFGCNLNDYLFKPITTTLRTIIKDLVKTAIIRHEARIDLIDLKLNTAQQYEGVLLLELEYEIRSTNSRSNYVFPFYLEEGTNT
jgi:phage baseplate assembly protein W